MTSNGRDLDDLVDEWVAADPDPLTRAELERRLIEDRDALGAEFSAPLGFGTAGIRGKLGAGPGRMNRVVVRRTAAGLAAHLPVPALVVVGHDARHLSAEFAADSAALLAAAGHRVVLIDGLVPTPVLAYALRRVDADAGVMVTASHNPPGDNGVKVYLAGGLQLVSPADIDIQERIAAAPLPARELEAAPYEVESADTAIDAYLGDLVDREPIRPAVRVAYTAMHGVGSVAIRRAFERRGVELHEVAEQAEPDPEFSTVSFPNPEEPGALDLLEALAGSVDADVALANDPDADRLGVLVSTESGWRRLTGDEIGVLLGDHAMATTSGDDRLVVSTVVSSRWLRRLAERRGVEHVETLTGFKWVMRPSLDRPERRFVFGYEEALGYAVGDAVRDKDGITAAVAFVETVAELLAVGQTVERRLDELAREAGLHVTANESVRFAHPADAREAVARLRRDPPECLGDLPISQIVDFRDHAERPTDLLRFVCADDIWVHVRPSGTEPKLKVYVDAASPPGGDAAEVRGQLGDRARAALRATIDEVTAS